jgi:hypothetical protein
MGSSVASPSDGIAGFIVVKIKWGILLPLRRVGGESGVEDGADG